MDIQWNMIWTQSNAVSARSRRQRDAFADPLERSEWDELGWSILPISLLVSGALPKQKNRQKIKEVERFTEAARRGAVCVS